MTARYLFELEQLEEALGALDAVSGRVSDDLEITMFIGRDMDGVEGRVTFAITGDALSETEEVREALSLLHDLPVVKKAIKSSRFVSCKLPDILKRYDEILDNRGMRYEANNMWTDVTPTTLLPGIRKIIDGLPPAPSHLYFIWWLPKCGRPDMAFSMEGRLYVALYAISQEKDGSVDMRNSEYVVSSMERME